ncbi:MAG: ATP synthase F1 subunit gamma [Bacteroidales bacterium]|nr:ATP synthase F1 subunit gamma [Bacteroidales bacterium]
MANLKEVRTRIASVSSTKKITSAMKMASAAKFKKAQNTLLKFRPYSDSIAALVHGLLPTKGMEGYMGSAKRTPRNALLLLICSNNSLCGAFNANIIKEAKRTHDRLRQEHPSIAVHFYCIGSKGEDLLRREGFTVVARNHECVDKPRFEASKEVFKELMSFYKEGRYDCIALVYNKFKNAATQELMVEPLLPIAPRERSKQRTQIPPIIEPSPRVLLSDLLPYYLQNQLHSAILESSTSEHGARMTAMHQATENASALYDELLLEYNKARQAAITDEILEIVSGANALNG